MIDFCDHISFNVLTAIHNKESILCVHIKYLIHFYPHMKILRYGKTPLIYRAQRVFFFLYDVTCQYETVDVAAAKVIAAEVIVCYLGMLCKLKTAVLAWFSVIHVQYEVLIDG